MSWLLQKGRELALLGNPVLRRKAKPVKNPQGKEVQGLVRDLFKTMEVEGGCGLAAPQIHESLRVFVMDASVCLSEEDKKLPEIRDDPMWWPVGVINPTIKAYSKRTDVDWEGCLSVPGMTGRVKRSIAIDVEFTSDKGELVRRKVSGYPARVFQHEHDHLDGVTYFDRVSNNKDIMMSSEYAKAVSGQAVPQ